mmetsp:Transcript_28338/g.83389  ORF Transcript_28338/g.83389 Transcript_28338/m.83389 type:complete len:207 (-) Transcript_28338:161-781(-)
MSICASLRYRSIQSSGRVFHLCPMVLANSRKDIFPCVRRWRRRFLAPATSERRRSMRTRWVAARSSSWTPEADKGGVTVLEALLLPMSFSTWCSLLTLPSPSGAGISFRIRSLSSEKKILYAERGRRGIPFSFLRPFFFGCFDSSSHSGRDFRFSNDGKSQVGLGFCTVEESSIEGSKSDFLGFAFLLELFFLDEDSLLFVAPVGN